MGDVIVSYLVIIGDNASVEAINAHFGYKDDAAALSDKAFLAYTRSKNPNHFASGTLLIDIVDARSFKLLKRNYAVRPLLRDAAPADTRAIIQSAVDEALAGLSIEK